jgi:hypothetical protein
MLRKAQYEENMAAKSSHLPSGPFHGEGPDEISGNAPGEASTHPRSRTRRWLRAAVFFAGSAAFGGLAVALWDRKTLAALRGKPADVPQPQADDDIY